MPAARPAPAEIAGIDKTLGNLLAKCTCGSITIDRDAHGAAKRSRASDRGESRNVQEFSLLRGGDRCFRRDRIAACRVEWLDRSARAARCVSGRRDRPHPGGGKAPGSAVRRDLNRQSASPPSARLVLATGASVAVAAPGPRWPNPGTGRQSGPAVCPVSLTGPRTSQLVGRPRSPRGGQRSRMPMACRGCRERAANPSGNRQVRAGRFFAAFQV
jgi:hypothetical protein